MQLIAGIGRDRLQPVIRIGENVFWFIPVESNLYEIRALPIMIRQCEAVRARDRVKQGQAGTIGACRRHIGRQKHRHRPVAERVGISAERFGERRLAGVFWCISAAAHRKQFARTTDEYRDLIVERILIDATDHTVPPGIAHEDLGIAQTTRTGITDRDHG